LVDKSIQEIYWLIKVYKKLLVDIKVYKKSLIYKSKQEIYWLIKVYKESLVDKSKQEIIGRY